MASCSSLTRVAALILGSLLASQQLSASPIQFKTEQGDVVPGNPRWPRGTTIHVYVPDDARFDDIKEGIERWADLLAERELKVEVHKGPPPPDATNAVQLNFVEPTALGTDSNGRRNDAEAQPAASTVERNGVETAGPITGGTIDVNKDLARSDYLKNLMQHEFGHILGFADEPTEAGKPHNVLDHTVESTGTMAFSDKDRAEIRSVYASADLPTPTGTMMAQVFPLADDGHLFVFTAAWLSGATIPFVQIGTNGAAVFDVLADGFPVTGTSVLSPNPAGWFLLDPRDPASLAGSVEDFRIVSSATGGDYLTFVNLVAPLGPDSPLAIFQFVSFSGIGTSLTYLTLDNFVVTTGPAAIPEPATAWVLALGLAGGMIVRHRRRRHAGSRQGAWGSRTSRLQRRERKNDHERK